MTGTSGTTRRRYVLEMGPHRLAVVGTSPEAVFRRFRRAYHVKRTDYAPLLRFKYWLEAGGWSPWMYQVPDSLESTP